MTNRIVREEFGIIHETQKLIPELLNVLTDADLTFKLPGNPTLGELCVVMGEVERIYIDSFKTFKQDWAYKQSDASMSGSVEKLKAWFKAQQAELDTVLSGLSEEDVLTRTIDRGHGFAPPVGAQVHIYREAILIFGGKVSVYLYAMGKTFPDQWKYWIG